MSNRFSKKKKDRSSRRNLWISLILFASVLAAVLSGISSISEKTDEETQKTLEQAVMRGITYCYAMEGAYPESLSYLKEHYGLFYNEDEYFIDYHPQGANMMPDVTIIKKSDD